MGLAAPSIGNWTGERPRAAQITRDIADHVGQVADARATRELMRGLSEMNGEDSTGLSKATGAIGEAFGGLAKGMQAVGDLQQSVLKSAMERMGTGGSGGGMTDMLGMVMVMGFLEDMQERREERKAKRSPASPEDSPLLSRYLDKLDKDLEEAKQRGGPSPADMQLHEMTMGLLGQHLANAADPMAQLKALREMQDTVGDLFGGKKGGGEYSEGALRMRAIEKDEFGLRAEHDRYLANLSSRERELAYHYPKLLTQGIAGLANLAGAFGLVPTQNLQFGGEADDEAAAAMASARQQRAGA